MSKPIRIKIAPKAAIEVGNFKDIKGEGFLSIRKMYRKEGEVSSKDWKPARQIVTIHLEHVKETVKALRTLADDIENAEVWEPTPKSTPKAKS